MQNIVVDGDVAWDEDFWTELQVHSGDKQAAAAPRLALTANCGRCRSINIDYDTGRVGEGEAGTLLKKLMKDRRVDAGNLVQAGNTLLTTILALDPVYAAEIVDASRYLDPSKRSIDEPILCDR